MYYYPNRPRLIPPDPENPMNPKPFYIQSLEATGRWIAEQKWNGDNCLIYTGSKPEFWNRHGTRLKYKPIPKVLEEVAAFPPDCVINAEMLHNKTKTIKDRLICHCIYVWEGKPLFGKTWGDARAILEAHDWKNNSQVTLSPIWTKGFWELFQQADGVNIEGIILKDPKGKLVISTREVPDVSWMLKIRKPCKKYNF